MKKIKFFLLIIFSLTLIVCSCSKKKDNIKFINEQGQEEKIQIKRFDKALFDKPLPNLEVFLKNLQKQYPQMFQTSLDNKEYLSIIEQFVLDNEMQNVQSIVEREYPDLNFLQEDLTSAFARLKQIYPNTKLPKNVFSLLFGPADFSYSYANRIVVSEDFCAISLDMYSMDKLRKSQYYKQIPQYMIPTLNRNYIAPDFIRQYLRQITFSRVPLVEMNPDCSFLDAIIEDGKYSYVVKTLLPKYSDSQILRYTDEQYSWCEKNEKSIWGYIIQNNLLFEKDRTKYLSLTMDGPESKGITNSPSRIGNYIGYNIVSRFMNETDISIDSLMKIKDAYKILKLSKYKPKK
ncbi:MAG: hypothetical protein LKE30_02275 [Bacteroidales bacterium]|jgi:hypothetical protein|nr:hypothetical protein [Bacteroidales bacterium]